MNFFNDSWHTKTYLALTQRARGRLLGVYSEKHHVIPKACGGTNDPSNVVKFTAREHFIAHMLLTKIMVKKKHQHQMAHALFCMCNLKNKHHQRHTPTARLYEYARKAHSKAMSESRMGIPLSPTHRQACLDADRSHLKGLPRSEAFKASRRGPKLKLRGPRPHIRGKNSPHFKHYWLTPWGKFESQDEAIKTAPFVLTSLKHHCMRPDRPVRLYGSSREYMQQFAGKTYREVGFGFEEVA